MTYTEEQIQGLINDIVNLSKKVKELEDKLEQEHSSRKWAEERYNDLCERCMSLYISEKNITTDAIFVQLNVPRFMSDSDFATGITQHLISSAKAERDKHIFNSKNTEWYKPIE